MYQGWYAKAMRNKKDTIKRTPTLIGYHGPRRTPQQARAAIKKDCRSRRLGCVQPNTTRQLGHTTWPMPTASLLRGWGGFCMGRQVLCEQCWVAGATQPTGLRGYGLNFVFRRSRLRRAFAARWCVML